MRNRSSLAGAPSGNGGNGCAWSSASAAATTKGSPWGLVMSCTPISRPSWLRVNATTAEPCGRAEARNWSTRNVCRRLRTASR